MTTRTAAAIVTVLTLVAIANELPDALRCPLLTVCFAAIFITILYREDSGDSN